MARKLRPVVSRYRQDAVLERFKHPDYSLCEMPGILPVLELLHEEPVGAPLYDGDNGLLVVRPDDGIHLKVTEPPAVSLRRPFVYADPAGDVCPARSHGPAAMLQPVPEVFVQGPPVTLVLPDPLVDGLMGYLYPVPCKVARYLLWRPLVIYQMAPDLVPYSLADGTVPRLAPAALVRMLLSPVPLVDSALARVALQLTRDGRGMHSYRFCD